MLKTLDTDGLIEKPLKLSVVMFVLHYDTRLAAKQYFAVCVSNTDVPAESGNDRPLDVTQIRKLSVNGIHLLDRIDPNHAFVTELATAGCITWPQREYLINIPQPRDCNDKLLEFITRRSVADYENFIRVLSKEQAHLVPLMVTDGGETFSDHMLTR